MPGGNLIPVVLVSGFLGSGKTTLIRRLLLDGRWGEVAVIVNEFGEVGIDHHLIRKTDERTVLLEGGCLCCSLRDDLRDALRDLLGARGRPGGPRFDRVVIETTGLADPVPILHTVVADPLLRNHYRVERVVVTLDAINGAANLASAGEAIRQVSAADQVVITKQDLAPEERAAELRAQVSRINPAAAIIDGGTSVEDLGPLVAPAPRGEGAALDAAIAGRFAGEETALPPSSHAPGGRVTSRCFLFDRPLDWQMFGLWLTMLLHRHGSRILRVKGLLNVGAERGPMMLEGVQHVIHAPRHLRDWPDADRRSPVVFIVRDLDLDQIEASLTAFQDVAAALRAPAEVAGAASGGLARYRR